MRAWTVHQPWAQAIFDLDKPVENRTCRVPRDVAFGDRIAIAASQDRTHLTPDPLWQSLDLDCLSIGTILGTVVYRGVIRINENGTVRDVAGYLDKEAVRQVLASRWTFGPVINVLADPRKLASPIPCRGMQGCWTVPPDVAERVRAGTVTERCAAGMMPANR